jgi:hypothetical protein
MTINFCNPPHANVPFQRFHGYRTTELRFVIIKWHRDPFLLLQKLPLVVALNVQLRLLIS